MIRERPLSEASFLSLARLLQGLPDLGTPPDECLPARAPGMQTLADNALLRGLFGREPLRDALGNEGALFSLIFSLRHDVVRLSLMLHALSLPNHEQAGFTGLVSERLGLAVNPEESLRTLLATLPVVGFSALGVHLLEVPRGRCRAFDAYDLAAGCTAAATHYGLCERHAHEVAWGDAPTGTQSVMFGFFADKDNVHLYSDVELIRLVERFWRRFSTQPHSCQPLLPALAYFGYKSREELTGHGLESLRKLFLQRARALHPDAGGSARAFVELRTHYEALRAQFQG